ncbi:MAG: Maltose/maltodextrin import ATP-binding protein MalK [Candidatus Accumulibacter regalis]|jgi:multiple sugar transport system ATP-binding protein|uniref:Maltose/maltodextrin import ATP-binding protein MalK n=1 Tax=Accumulibacter regalis TaxID=522306 RepID=A0A011PRL8_ACCRE|nr:MULTISPECIES: ATP-binding cassette domain-containing protein [unclassified Candidatus Accumulibacter]EXI90071.1 MAG: Maltose/maltodextrin import ATP-binding protein MalK [Candidatus Accumulibacter regalis]MQM34232.1 ABC transporter ATP-binding protein [Candidatus Accumulibacter phosphatis]MBL8368937.1 ATP-binding cassette domain-containing protein [Accumulibacter sp.]MBN8515780.1 ATP-binding cassette domain-containing protein [Accumulibacter sp.]HRE71802.1 ATP-binding cassette domain-contai
MSRIELRGVSKDFGNTPVLNDIDLSISPGEFCVFVGPSGCGKSTLLRLLAGLEDPSAGEIEIDGVLVNHLPPARRNVAMVFQSYALYPHMSVHQNMAFGLQHRKLPSDEIERRIADAVRILQLDSLLQRRPRELSGGQRQRVAIARAIVRQPKVFLFDEPLSNLDAALRVHTRLEIARLHRALGSASMVYVTHDQVEAMTLADRIVLLQPLAGRRGAPSVAQAGPPLDLYHHPANRFVAGFIGSPAMNFVDARVKSLGDEQVVADASGMLCAARLSSQGLTPGEPVTLGIRPEHVVLGQGPQRARVSHVERLGELSHVYLDLPGASTPLLAKSPRDDIAIGELLAFDFPAQVMHLFRSDGVAQARGAACTATRSGRVKSQWYEPS